MFPEPANDGLVPITEARGSIPLYFRADPPLRTGMEMRTNRDYEADLLAHLRIDPAYQALYLAAAQKDSREALLLALRDVAEARIGRTNSRHQGV
jgi:hypothetical protein